MAATSFPGSLFGYVIGWSWRTSFPQLELAARFGILLHTYRHAATVTVDEVDAVTWVRLHHNDSSSVFALIDPAGRAAYRAATTNRQVDVPEYRIDSPFRTGFYARSAIAGYE